MGSAGTRSGTPTTIPEHMRRLELHDEAGYSTEGMLISRCQAHGIMMAKSASIDGVEGTEASERTLRVELMYTTDVWPVGTACRRRTYNHVGIACVLRHMRG